MLNPSLRNDLARALRTHRYEPSGDGRILLPAAGAFVGGAFKSSLNGEDARISPNVLVDQGLIDILKVYLAQGAQRTAFYIAPFAGNVVPDGTALTAANFDATQTEFVDYSETTRPAWTPDAIATKTAANAATPATFTISVINSTVWGFAMLTASAKNATTGVLLCCSKDAAARSNLQIGDKLNVEYDITAQDVP